MSVIRLEWFSLLLATLLLILPGFISAVFRLNLDRPLFFAGLRTILQLICLGYILQYIFHFPNPALLLVYLLISLVFAAITVQRRMKKKTWADFLAHFWALLLPTLVIGLYLFLFVIHARPWYSAQYTVPLLGMLLGNAMNSLALSLNHYYQDMSQRRWEIEELLALGATPWEASFTSVKSSLATAMIPTINSMNAVGLVFIPGMMTGQVIAGQDPMAAAYYQIVVMFMIAAANALAAMLGLFLAQRKTFNDQAQYIG